MMWEFESLRPYRKKKKANGRPSRSDRYRAQIQEKQDWSSSSSSGVTQFGLFEGLVRTARLGFDRTVRTLEKSWKRKDIPSISQIRDKKSSSRLNVIQFSPFSFSLATRTLSLEEAVRWKIDAGSSLEVWKGFHGFFSRPHGFDPKGDRFFVEDFSSRIWKRRLLMKNTRDCPFGEHSELQMNPWDKTPRELGISKSLRTSKIRWLCCHRLIPKDRKKTFKRNIRARSAIHDVHQKAKHKFFAHDTNREYLFASRE